MIPTLIRNYTAEAAVAANILVKLGAAAGTVVPATAATDAIIGVSSNIASDAGHPCDVIHDGIADVKAGGTLTAGALVTSDTAGAAVGAASGNRVLGVALEAAVAGDIIPVLLSLG